MNLDMESEKEGINVVMRHVALRNVVERVEPLKSEKTDLPPINMTLVEIESDPISVPIICSDEAKFIRGDQVSILNFVETASIATQVPRKCEMIKIGQPALPIIKAEYQDGVKEKKISAMKIACQLGEVYQFCTYEDSVYVFENGHYKPCNNKMLERIIYLVFKRSDIIPSGYNFLKDVRKFLTLETMSKKFTADDVEHVRKYIGFKNGYLHLDTLKFTDPNPAIFITNFLEVDYNPHLLANVSNQDLKKIHCPNFDRFITTLSDDNPQIFDRIYEMIGYILSNDCAAKKLFVMGGVCDSGKSKLGAFIIGLFNEGAVISIPIGDLGERFSLGDLPGKALCSDLDLPATKINAKTAAKIKSLTGGDATSAENKFESRKTFVNRAKLFFATNHPIEMSEKEYVLRERFVNIPITRTIPKEQQYPNLLDYFEYEKLLIVMKSIGYYFQLVKNHYEFTGDFDLNSAFIHNSNGIAMPLEDMINRFVTEKCSFVSLKQWGFSDDLYKSFCAYYEIAEDDNEYKNFSRMVNRLFSDKVKRTKKRRENSPSPLSAFEGVILKESY